MKAFELPAGTRLKLLKTTPRKEIHGDELVQAISLKLRWETTNDSLTKLHANLKDMLFYRAAPEEAQAKIDGVPEITPNLRCPAVSLPLKVEGSFTGYTLTIEHGIDDDSALELYECTQDKFSADAKEGGTAIIDWSLSSNNEVTPEMVGALCALEGTEITLIQLKAPEVKPDPVIDGTVGHPGLAAMRAEAAGQARLDIDGEAAADQATDAFLGIHGGTAEDDDPPIATGDGGAAEEDEQEPQDDADDDAGPQFAEEAKPRRGRRTAAAGGLE